MVGLVLLSSVAQASSLRLTLPCGSMEEVIKILVKYNEKPMLNMKSTRTQDDQPTQTMVTLFVNPETGTYSLVERVSDTLFCVLSSGEDLRVVNQ